LHSVWPSTSWYSPARHLSHVVELEFTLYVPGAHGVGNPLPTLQKVPGGQTMHSSSRLERKPVRLSTVWFACVPPGHGWGADEPATHR
jgi:hypothetical protein